MKLSPDTIEILKNFAVINSNLYVEQGNTIVTESIAQDIRAIATINETFPVSFAIYDLSNFLSVLSLHKDSPELEFDEFSVNFKALNGRSSIKYGFTDPSKILVPKPGTPKLNSDVSFELSKDDYLWLNKSAKVLGNPHVTINSNGESVKLVSKNYEDSSANIVSIDLDIDANENIYDLVFKIDNLNFIPGNYQVTIDSRGLSKFVSIDRELTYYVALEKNSTFK